MVKRYAMIEDNIVINLCLWDGSTDTWAPPDGVLMVVIDGQSFVDIGYRYENGTFVEPVNGEVI